MLRRIIFAAILLASARPSYAAETEAERQACLNDAQTHCPDEIPDRERVYACLVDKVAQLSAPCKKIITDSLNFPQQQPRRRR
jgi:hypothetical protein